VRWLLKINKIKLNITRVTSSRECLAQMLNQETKEKFNKNRREGKKYV